MLNMISAWFQKHFSDPEAVLLLIVLILSFSLVIFLGDILAPVFISILISYFLMFWVDALKKYKVPNIVAYSFSYLIFLSIFIVALFVILPLLWDQVTNLFLELPSMLQNIKTNIVKVTEQYSDYVPEQQVEELIAAVIKDVQSWGKKILSVSISSIPGIITWLVYLVLVPLLVFFFLKDRETIINWFSKFLPEKRLLLQSIWHEMDSQIGNYIRGKIAEIIVVTFFTYIVFLYFNLQYAILLSALVGLSVVIPYVGAVMVTIPVFFVGFLQWGFDGGFTGELAMMMYAYSIVQILDGNILVPLLFSEAVNLHPVAIIIAILVFGSFWGFWGVFLAIPLATLVKAILNSWPSSSNVQNNLIS